MRNTVVIDTSLVLTWLLNEPDSNKAVALLAKWSKEGVVMLAPPLLVYEAANALYQQVRRGKFTLDAAKQSMAEIIIEGLELDFWPDLTLSTRAMELAHHFNLPATYDPHYLALAERENCELWTADTRMWRVVKREFDWVHSIGDYAAP